jgi:hypothetical protein
MGVSLAKSIVETTTARRIAILLSWSISFGGSAAAIVRDAPQVVVMGAFFGGLLPYIVCLQVIEPWLDRRRTQR